MPGKFHHEHLYLGAAALDALARLRVTLCGAGAVGSNLADNLVRHGVRHLRAIDRDKVDEHNVSTQLYGESDVGGWKVDVLRNRLFKTAGVEVEAVRKELLDRNARQLLGGNENGAVVVDAFDNRAARQAVQAHCRAGGVPCLHVGLCADYAEVVWDGRYRVPHDPPAGDVCDYPLARNLVLLATAVTTESLIRFAATGDRVSRTVTLADMTVRDLPPREDG